MPYTSLEHTADIRIEVSGESIEDVFASALEGMTATIAPEYADPPGTVRRTISLRSDDYTSLLIDFLAEVLFLVQTERECYETVEFGGLT